MSLNHSPAIVTDGLVLCLDAANQRSYPKSGTTWSDLAGANDGVFANSMEDSFSTTNRGLFAFDGVGDYASTSSNFLNGLTLYGGITLSAWVNPASLASQGLVLGVWRQYEAGDQAALFIINSGPLVAVADGSTAESGAGVSNSLSVGVWQYIAATWQTNRSYKLYKNGDYIGGGTQSGNGFNSSSSGSNFYIGAQKQNNSRFYNGEMSSVSVYNRALSADEVRQNYEATVGRYT
jgi:hypothetical protein